MFQLRFLRPRLISRSKGSLLEDKINPQMGMILPPAITYQEFISTYSTKPLKWCKPYLKNISRIHKIVLFENTRIATSTCSLNDDIVAELKNSSNFSEMFGAIHKYRGFLRKEHIMNIILKLYDFEERESLENLHANSGFLDFLRLIEQYSQDLDAMEVTGSLLFISNVVPTNHETVEALIQRYDKMLEDNPSELTLCDVSAYAAYYIFLPQIKKYLNNVPVLHRVLEELDRCTNASDMYLITKYLRQYHLFMSQCALLEYKKKLKTLVESEIITAEHSYCVIAALNLLRQPPILFENTEMIDQLLTVFNGKIHLLKAPEVIKLLVIYTHIKHPRKLLEDLRIRGEEILKETDDLDVKAKISFLLHSNLPLLYGQEFRKTIILHENLEQFLVQQWLNGISNYSNLLQLSSQNFSHIWLQVYGAASEFGNEYSYLKNLANKYLEFYKISKFSCKNIERILVNRFIREMENNSEYFTAKIRIPAAIFVLTFGQQMLPLNILQNIFNEVQEVTPRIFLSVTKPLVHSITILSNCNETIDPNISKKMERVYNEGILQVLKDPNRTFMEILSVFTSANFIGVSDTNINKELCQLIERRSAEETINDLTRVQRIRFMTKKLDYVVPNLIESSISCIIKNRESVSSTLCAIFLRHCCYDVGYTPTDEYNEFFDIINEALCSNSEDMRIHLLLEIAIALCFFGHLSPKIIEIICSLKFLKKMDEDPVNRTNAGKHSLMQFNRAVCLDYPEAGIPWFHEKYCQDQLVKEEYRKCPFSDSVYDILKEVVNVRYITRDAESPYHYRLNFLLDPKVCGTNKGTNGTVILLLLNQAFSTHGKYLKGPYQLKIRHLQMLGYDVIPISEKFWNSLSMCDRDTKCQFLVESINANVAKRQSF